MMVNQPVVIDNGSGWFSHCSRVRFQTKPLFLGVIKAGFAGDTIPKCIFLNLVGRPKHIRVMAGALEGDHFIGLFV